MQEVNGNAAGWSLPKDSSGLIQVTGVNIRGPGAHACSLLHWRIPETFGGDQHVPSDVCVTIALFISLCPEVRGTTQLPSEHPGKWLCQLFWKEPSSRTHHSHGKRFPCYDQNQLYCSTEVKKKYLAPRTEWITSCMNKIWTSTTTS